MTDIGNISYSTLLRQNATSTNAIIDHYADNVSFQKLAKYEGEMTWKRDQEDDEKLAKGIRFAQQKGVLDPQHVPEPYNKIDVFGKTPEEVSNYILDQVHEKQDSLETGFVIVLCGLSGTGKGTTVSMLQQKLETSGHKVVTWSNGNIFRAVTLLASTWCEQKGLTGFDPGQALTRDNIQDFMTMLSFGKFQNDQYDIRIQGLGLDLFVRDIQNTLLKDPKVSTNIPTVAEVTQGEVVVFASSALQILATDGWVVLLEGREPTVNYVPTPHRFTLTLQQDDGMLLIGKRRAAQRLMGATLAALKQHEPIAEDAPIVETTLDTLLKDMCDEIQQEESSSLFCLKWFTSK